MANTNFSPREIVSELDRFIVGQADAKREACKLRRKMIKFILLEPITVHPLTLFCLLQILSQNQSLKVK